MTELNRRRALIALCTFASMPVLSACGSREQPHPPATFSPQRFQPWSEEAPAYRLFPGDEVEVTVHTAQELSGVVPVGPDGRINLSLAGSIMVSELSANEASRTIAQRYAQVLRDPIVEVRPVSFGSQQILVGGEVTNPGVFDMTSARMGVLEAVMLAGGATPRARRSRIVVLRRAENGGVMLREVDLTRALEGQAGDLVPLARHDIVFVPRTTIAEVNDFVDQYIGGILPIDTAFAYALVDAAFNNNN